VDRAGSAAEPKTMHMSWSSQKRCAEELPLAMQLLAEGVPLLLLLDLAAPTGPDSEDIAASERVSRR